MKKLLITLALILSLSVFAHAQSGDQNYEEGHDGATENQGERSNNEDGQQGATIDGEWDTHGTHYTPAGGGNKWRQDGTFMQKAAGGYIDTKTGRFIPSTE